MVTQYLIDLSMNVKRGNRTKLERGEWPNKAPLGYLNDKANKTIVIDRKLAKYVRRAFELYATSGYSLLEVSDILYRERFRSKDGKKIYKAKIHQIFTNCFYTGVMKFGGKLYPGKHKPLIKTSLYKKVQDVFEDRLHPKPKKHFYSARGFLTCATCGCAITADTKKGLQYYYCTNGKRTCTEKRHYMHSEHIDKILSKLFKELQINEETIEIAAEAYWQKNSDLTRTSNQANVQLLEELESLDKRESILVDGFCLTND